MSPRHLQCLENITISHHIFIDFSCGTFSGRLATRHSLVRAAGLSCHLTFPGEYDNIPRIGEAEKGPIRRLNFEEAEGGVVIQRE